MLRSGESGTGREGTARFRSPARIKAYFAGLLLIGLLGLYLGSAGAARAAPPAQAAPTATPLPGILAVRVSSAYTTGGLLFDGVKTLDGDIGTGWISDFTQPPRGQWIELDLASGLGVTELGLTNYTTAMRYSRPQTTTLQYADGTTAPLAWQNTSQDQRQPLRRPATGRIRLIVDTVWGNGSQAQQPLGVAEIIPFADSTRLGLSTAATRITPGSAATLTIAPPRTDPTATSPATLPVTTTATGPSNSAGGTDPWRWWLVGVMVILAGFFLVRGLRRQRRR